EDRVDVQLQVLALALELGVGDRRGGGGGVELHRAAAVVDLGDAQVVVPGVRVLGVGDRAVTLADALGHTGRTLPALTDATVELLARTLGPGTLGGDGQVVLEVVGGTRV